MFEKDFLSRVIICILKSFDIDGDGNVNRS